PSGGEAERGGEGSEYQSTRWPLTRLALAIAPRDPPSPTRGEGKGVRCTFTSSSAARTWPAPSARSAGPSAGPTRKASSHRPANPDRPPLPRGAFRGRQRLDRPTVGPENSSPPTRQTYRRAARPDDAIAP